MLVDTHCHLVDAAFSTEAAREAVARAAAAGVAQMIVVGESRDAAERALAFVADDDRRLSTTAGIHPHVARDWNPETAAWLADTLRDERVVAAGEMGLDYHYDHSPRDSQQAAFDAQLALAASARKPAVIHAREADADVAAILRNHPDTLAVLHSFSSGPALLDAGIELGHYVSFSGMITFKSWSMDDAIARVPLDRLLVETDAPYLAPVPHRGKRNEPALVVHVAARLAAVLGKTCEEIAEITTANAERLFGPRLTRQFLIPES